MPIQPAPTTEGTVIATITVSMPAEAYLRRVRTLAAWWSLGSSGVEPHVLMRYALVTLSGLREAGL